MNKKYFQMEIVLMKPLTVAILNKPQHFVKALNIYINKNNNAQTYIFKQLI